MSKTAKRDSTTGEHSLLALSQMAHVIHLFKRYRQAHVTAFGVTVPQYHAMMQLEQYGELHPSRIADLLFSDRPTTTVILRNLERRGWVERHRDESNRKYMVVRLTKAGRAKLERLRRAEEEQARGFDLLGCFTSEERRTLERLLDRLIVHFRNLPAIRDREGESQ